MRRRRAWELVLTLVMALASTEARAAVPVEEAREIIRTFERELVPSARARFGATFEFYFNPDIQTTQPVVAASADRSGSDWSISFFGPGVRHPKLTRDGFILLLCHEVGHHFGGAPLKNDEHGKPRWANVEGQADYYATAVCAKRMFELLAEPFFSASYPRDVKAACALRVRGRKEIKLCARALVAAESFVEALSEKFYPWTATDSLVVSRTEGSEPDPRDGHYAYPSYDCRMATLRAGAFCQQLPAPTNADLIGASGREANCASGEGRRPSCWFAP